MQPVSGVVASRCLKLCLNRMHSPSAVESTQIKQQNCIHVIMAKLFQLQVLMAENAKKFFFPLLVSPTTLRRVLCIICKAIVFR